MKCTTFVQVHTELLVSMSEQRIVKPGRGKPLICGLKVKFYGCRHVLLEEYDIIREELIKREYLSIFCGFTASQMTKMPYHMTGDDLF